MLNPFEDAQLDAAACLEYLAGSYNFDLLPGIPALVPLPLAACILSVSNETMDKLVFLGQIPVVNSPGEPEKAAKKDLIKYIQNAFLCNESVLITEIPPSSTPKQPHQAQDSPIKKSHFLL